MANANITDRISDMPTTTNVKPEDVVAVSQISGSRRNTVSLPISKLTDGFATRLSGDAHELLKVSSPLEGDGTLASPIKINKAKMDEMYLSLTNFRASSVGDSAIRQLPFSLERYSRLGYWDRRYLVPVCQVTPDGTFRLHQHEVNSYQMALSKVDVDLDFNRSYVLEKKITASFLPEGYWIDTISGNTESAAIISTKNSSGASKSYFVLLRDGDLKASSMHSPILMDAAIGAGESTGVVALYVNGTRWLLRVGSVFKIDCYITVDKLVGGDIDNPPTVQSTNWTTACYTGTYTGPQISISTGLFVGNRPDFNVVGDVTVDTSTLPRSTSLSACHDNQDTNKVYVLARRTVELDGDLRVFDMPLSLNMSQLTAQAIGPYLTGKPSYINGNVSGMRPTILPTSNVNNFAKILSDGSIFFSGAGEDDYYLYKSQPGKGPLDTLNMVESSQGTAILKGPVRFNAKSPLPASSLPGEKIYQTSPIDVLIDKKLFTIPPATYVISKVLSDTPIVTLGELPYFGNKLSGLNAKVVGIYVNANGISFAGGAKMLESDETTLVGKVIYIYNQSKTIVVDRLLVAEAFSRLGLYRPSVQPIGCAVPVSLARHGQQPTRLWLSGTQPSTGPRPNEVVRVWASSTPNGPEIREVHEGSGFYLNVDSYGLDTVDLEYYGTATQDDFIGLPNQIILTKISEVSNLFRGTSHYIEVVSDGIPDDGEVLSVKAHHPSGSEKRTSLTIRDDPAYVKVDYAVVSFSNVGNAEYGYYPGHVVDSGKIASSVRVKATNGTYLGVGSMSTGSDFEVMSADGGEAIRAVSEPNVALVKDSDKHSYLISIADMMDINRADRQIELRSGWVKYPKIVAVDTLAPITGAEPIEFINNTDMSTTLRLFSGGTPTIVDGEWTIVGGTELKEDRARYSLPIDLIPEASNQDDTSTISEVDWPFRTNVPTTRTIGEPAATVNTIEHMWVSYGSALDSAKIIKVDYPVTRDIVYLHLVGREWTVRSGETTQVNYVIYDVSGDAPVATGTGTTSGTVALGAGGQYHLVAPISGHLGIGDMSVVEAAVPTISNDRKYTYVVVDEFPSGGIVPPTELSISYLTAPAITRIEEII